MKHFSIGDEPMKRDDIDIRYIEYGCDEPEHSHDAIEIVYIVSGSGEHIVNGKTLRAQRGLLLVLDYSSVHSFRVWQNMKYYNLLIKPSFLSEKLDGAAGLDTLMRERYNYEPADNFLSTLFSDSQASQRVEDLFFGILNEGIRKQTRYIDIIRCYVDEIINLALRNVETGSGVVFDAHLAEAVNYISDNCNETLRLEDVAKRTGYNQRYFSSKLKEYCGLSFKQLLLSKRLSSVIENLWKTDDTIDEIISRCGFTNKTYFYEMFEKAYGVKPKFIREYRNNYNKYLELRVGHSNLLK